MSKAFRKCCNNTCNAGHSNRSTEHSPNFPETKDASTRVKLFSWLVYKSKTRRHSVNSDSRASPVFKRLRSWVQRNTEYSPYCKFLDSQLQINKPIFYAVAWKEGETIIDQVTLRYLRPGVDEWMRSWDPIEGRWKYHPKISADLAHTIWRCIITRSTNG